MRREDVSADFIRFVVGGAINTALTSAVYFASLTVLTPALSYAVAWLAGIAIVLVAYPDLVFPGGRRSFKDRSFTGTGIIVVFLIGLLFLRSLAGPLGPAVAFAITLVLTTLLNFMVSRLILRRS